MGSPFDVRGDIAACVHLTKRLHACKPRCVTPASGTGICRCAAKRNRMRQPVEPKDNRPMIADEFISRAARLLDRGQRVLLGLVGAPGSGKSTCARELADAFAGRAVVVPMDGFHLSNAELARLGRASRKGAPDTFDASGYVALLRRLRSADETVYAPAFHRDLEEAIAGSIAIPPTVPLVITEGNYLLLADGPWV